MMDLLATTYNVLADAYVSAKRYPECAPDDLDPDRRRERLVEKIVEIGSDLLCLQEVERPLFEALGERLSNSHVGRLAIKQGRSEGCALFIAKSLEVERFDTLRYRASTRSGNHLALLAILDTSSGRFGVASTHLQWMPPGTARDAHVGVQQIVELLDRVDVDEAVPWILAGDFNAEFDSPVLDAARERGFLLSCADQDPWYTTNLNRRLRKIDYLLVSQDAFHVSPLELPPLREDTPLPSQIHPSDHLPLSIRISMP